MSQPVLIVGSVAYDTIITPRSKGERILGGSASYACLACSYFSPAQMVGIVGNDFAPEHRQRLKDHGIDLTALQVEESGKTFFWQGEYSADFKNRETQITDLNVFEHFQPEIPESHSKPAYVMLGNIGPELQHHLLDQVTSKPFVIADTMNLWIDISRQSLVDLIKRVDLLVVNDEEAELLTGEENVHLAAKKLMEMGPSHLIIKKGPHGALLYHPEGIFTVPSYPVTELNDPTGAGDSFAGAFIGYLAKHEDTSAAAMKQALLYATATASLTVEAFSCDRLETAGNEAIEQRYQDLLKMTQI